MSDINFFDIFPKFVEAPYSYIWIFFVLIFSILGFKRKSFFFSHVLHPYRIWRKDSIHTLFTSAFIHRNFLHLANNLLIIYALGYDMFGNIQQEYGSKIAYLLTPFLFTVFTIAPNICQVIIKRNDFSYTAIGSSGLSFALYGFSAMFFPIQPMRSTLFPFITYAYSAWLLLLVVLLLLALVKRNPIINTQLHINAFLMGGFFGVATRPSGITEIVNVI